MINNSINLIIISFFIVLLLTSAYYYFGYSLLLLSLFDFEYFNDDLFLLTFKIFTFSLFHFSCILVIFILVVFIVRYSFITLDLILLNEKLYFQKKLLLLIIKNYLFNFVFFLVIYLIAKYCYGEVLVELSIALYVSWLLGFLSSIKTKKNLFNFGVHDSDNSNKDFYLNKGSKNDENTCFKNVDNFHNNSSLCEKNISNMNSCDKKYNEDLFNDLSGNYSINNDNEECIYDSSSNKEFNYNNFIIENNMCEENCNQKGNLNFVLKDESIDNEDLFKEKLNIKDYIFFKSVFNTGALFISYLIVKQYVIS